jgi:multiple sugar transport system substrate-binding protein
VSLAIGGLADLGGTEARAALAAVNAQRGEWEARTRARATVNPEPKGLPQAASQADVVVFRADRIGDLIDAGALAAIPGQAVTPPDPPGKGSGASESPTSPADRLAFAEILPAFRDQAGRWGEDLMALPVGGSALVLVYRRDVFDRPENVEAAKAAGVSLEPPRTYAQLEALAKFLHGRDSDGDGAPEAGIALALGADAEGVADAVFLARAAALGKHPDHFSFLFDDETMAPWIDWPPFVEALAGLATLKDLGPPGADAFDAEAARAAFREGRAALLIDRAERASRWTDPKRPLAVAVAALPGSERVYDPDRRDWQPMDPPNRPSYLPYGGGWMVGLSSRAKATAREAALDFLCDVAGSEASTRILADRDFPVLPTRNAQLGGGLADPRSAPGVDSRSWGRAVTETLTAGQILPGLRIPEADGYLADLTRARVEAIGKGLDPATALKRAAEAWTVRTQRLGVDRQKWHYRRSLNRPTPTRTPPPRPTSNPTATPTPA